MEIEFSEKFLIRVEECSDYIALDNNPAAITWSNRVFEHCEQLREHPQSGRIVSEFARPEFQEIIHGQYRLIYEIKPDRIVMLTIWHTSQILPDDDAE